MPIPDYQSVMLPLLKYLSDEQEHTFRECVNSAAEYFELTEDERKQLLSSGVQSIFDNRVSWARIYLKKALLVESPARGVLKITQRGLELLKEKPGK